MVAGVFLSPGLPVSGGMQGDHSLLGGPAGQARLPRLGGASQGGPPAPFSESSCLGGPA